MRINQYVAAASGLSRRAADAAVAAGRVSVDGHPAHTGQTVARPKAVLLDNQPITLPVAHTYIALNKPAGYVTSRVHQGAHPTIYALLPPELQALRPVGRLDLESCGLLLLSDDGAFIHRYTHPSFSKSKVYQLTLDHAITPGHLRQLGVGVELKDGLSRLLVISQQNHGRSLTVSLEEGRNRQIRRTLGALGYRIDKLQRLQVGPYALGQLAEGQWRQVAPQEVAL